MLPEEGEVSCPMDEGKAKDIVGCCLVDEPVKVYIRRLSLELVRPLSGCVVDAEDNDCGFCETIRNDVRKPGDHKCPDVPYLST